MYYTIIKLSKSYRLWNSNRTYLHIMCGGLWLLIEVSSNLERSLNMCLYVWRFIQNRTEQNSYFILGRIQNTMSQYNIYTFVTFGICYTAIIHTCLILIHRDNLVQIWPNGKNNPWWNRIINDNYYFELTICCETLDLNVIECFSQILLKVVNDTIYWNIFNRKKTKFHVHKKSSQFAKRKALLILLILSKLLGTLLV